MPAGAGAAERGPGAGHPVVPPEAWLFYPTEIVAGFRTTNYFGNIRQTAVIEGIFPVKEMKSSDQASVIFRYRHSNGGVNV